MGAKLTDPAKILETVAHYKPEGRAEVLAAAKLAGCSKETIGYARVILRECSKEEIDAVKTGEVSITNMGQAIRRGAPKGARIAAAQQGLKDKIQRQREAAALYGALKEALVAIASLPRPADVVEATRKTQKLSDDVQRCLPLAIKWLKEFEHEFCNKKAA